MTFGVGRVDGTVERPRQQVGPIVGWKDDVDLHSCDLITASRHHDLAVALHGSSIMLVLNRDRPAVRNNAARLANIKMPPHHGVCGGGQSLSICDIAAFG